MIKLQSVSRHRQWISYDRRTAIYYSTSIRRSTHLSVTEKFKEKSQNSIQARDPRTEKLVRVDQEIFKPRSPWIPDSSLISHMNRSPTVLILPQPSGVKSASKWVLYAQMKLTLFQK